MANALDSGVEKIRKVQAEVVVDEDAPVDDRGNSVSLQKELGEMTQNGLLYDFATEMTSQKFGLLRKAIAGTK